MKKIILAGVVLLCGILFYSSTFAKAPKRVERKRTVARVRHSRVFSGLDLTKEQQEKIRKIMSEARKKIFDEVLTDKQKVQLKEKKKSFEKSSEKRKKRREEFIKKFDKNKDGKIDKKEKEAIKKGFKKRK